MFHRSHGTSASEQNFASPRYSEKFVYWIVAKYEENHKSFERTKEQFDVLKANVS